MLVPRRLRAAINRLRGFVWGKERPLTIESTEARPDYISWAEATRQPRRPIVTPTHWGRLFDQAWFRVEIPGDAVPGSWLRWKDEGEATLYVEGVPYYGFDNLHRAVRLPDGAREVWIESLCARAGIWEGPTGVSREGSRLEGAVLVERDEAAFESLVSLEFLLELVVEENAEASPLEPQNGFSSVGFVRGLEAATPRYRRLLRALDGAVDAFDREGVVALRAALAALPAKLPPSPHRTRAVLTGHAHIDLVWLWPEGVGERKAVHTFSSMLRLLEKDPEFHFGYSQPASYRAVERLEPELMRQVRARIAEGRWEATGAMWVESDTLIACGEALLRGLRIGQEALRDLTGESSRVLWLPDVFGYSPCLPQLMRMTGVEYFYTTKLTWGSLNRFPFSSFRWIGHDGSEVIAHVSQAHGYNERVSGGGLRAAERNYRQADVHSEYLIPTGVGDGGGGTSEEMLLRARLATQLDGMPEVKWGRIDGFFDGLATVRDDLPAWQGELYLEYHRGTYTTRAEMKAAMRAAERGLQALEAVHAATGAGPIEGRRWERVVFAQFHDAIPGTSIDEVYREIVPELAGIGAESRADAARGLGEAGAEALFNPLPIPRRVLVGAPGSRELVALAPLSGGPVAELPRVVAAVVEGDEGRLTNDRVEATFDAAGRLLTLRVDGQVVALAAPAGDLEVFPDFPAEYDAWDIDRQALDLGTVLDAPAERRVVRVDAGEVALEFRRAFGAGSTVTTRYRLLAGEAVLRIEYDLDLREPQTLVKVHFPTHYAGRSARFGTAFGSVLRGQQAGDPRDEAQWEVPGSRWAAVLDDSGGEGLFLVTEAKYGFSARDGRLSVSLARSARATGGVGQSYVELFPATIRRDVGPEFADLGRHVIAMAVGAFAPGAEPDRQPAMLADLLYTPPVPYRGPAVDAGLLAVEGAPSLAPAWAEPLADGRWALRLHETLGARGVATIHMGPGWMANGAGPEVEIAFRPYEIVTVECERVAR